MAFLQITGLFKMATTCLRLVLLMVILVLSVYGQDHKFTPINSVNHPSVIFYAENNGSFTLEAQNPGNVHFNTSANHTIYYKKTDLLEIIKLVNAGPPVWEDYGTYGYLGVFRGLQKISVFIRAKDPEDRELTYKLVAGDLPTGVSLNEQTGEIRGIAPDIDTTYIFTIRATNGLTTFADAVFKLVLKDSHVCRQSPCQNEGTCVETHNTFRCNCLHPFGGELCKLNCTSNPLGVSTSLKKVHNAQMTAFGTYSTESASNGRLGGSGWKGKDGTSWLQIDLGTQTDLHGVQMQGVNVNLYTGKFYLQYSMNGNHFENYTSPFTGLTEVMTGPASPAVTTNHLPSNIQVRFVRLIPISWNTRYQPTMRVELLGCHMY